MNAKLRFFGLVVYIVSVIGFSLLIKYGLGISVRSSTEDNVDSPDQSEHTMDSNDEKIDNRVKKMSNNSTSYHGIVGAGIVIMMLIIPVLYYQFCTSLVPEPEGEHREGILREVSMYSQFHSPG